MRNRPFGVFRTFPCTNGYGAFTNDVEQAQGLLHGISWKHRAVGLLLGAPPAGVGGLLSRP